MLAINQIYAVGTTTWTYDTATMGVGKLASVSAPGSYVEGYSYDTYGRLSRVKRQIGSEYFYIDQTYDSLGRVEDVKYPGSVNGDASGGPEADANRLRVKNQYNNFGYLTSVKDVAGSTVYWQANTVDEAGRVTEEKLGNGLYTQRLYQRESGHLLQIATGTSAGGTQVQDLQFAFDQAANLRVRKDRSPGVNGGAGIREQYSYDKLYRLTQTAQYNDTTNAPLAATQTYAFDEFGNLTAKGTGYSNFTYPGTRTNCANTINRPHAVYEVTTPGSITRRYCYDANGNLTKATEAKYGELTWWVSNLVKRVSTSSTNYTEFTYGPDRARYKQYRTRGAGDAETTLYIGALYEKRAKVAGGTTTIQHTHYIRAGDQVIATAQRTKVGAGAVGNAVYRYLHRDHLGSVTTITDAGGALLERSGFDPWGKRTDYSTWAPPAPGQFVPGGSGTGGTTYAVTSTPRGYTGHEQVDELGFIHMNGRIYDPEIGKFLSADPTMQYPESTQGFNRYAYAGNNPLTNVDPSGFSFFKSLLKVVGFALNFVPGFQGWANGFWQALVQGFLMSGGDLRGGLLSAVTAGLGSALSSGISRMLGVAKGFMTGLAGSFLANTAVAVAMGQKVGAALRSTIEGMARNFAIQYAVDGITRILREASAAGTQENSQSVSKERPATTQNAAATEAHNISTAEVANVTDNVRINSSLTRNNRILAVRTGDQEITLFVSVTVGPGSDPYGAQEHVDASLMDRIVEDINANANIPSFRTEDGWTHKVDIFAVAVADGGSADITVYLCTPARCRLPDGNPAAGSAVVGGSHMWIDPEQFSPSVAAHEFMHNLGLGHSEKGSGGLMSYDKNRRFNSAEARRLIDRYCAPTPGVSCKN